MQREPGKAQSPRLETRMFYVDPQTPRKVTAEDLERASANRDRRHTRVRYRKQLLAIIEGKLVLSKEQHCSR